MEIKRIDYNLINFFRRISLPIARIGLFVVFFWFGFLKILDLSPASGLVQLLFERTIPFMSFSHFMVFFGIFECLIGVLFLIKGAERIVIPLLFVHLITTFLPLIIVPDATWLRPFVPTLEGQYIIKNIVIIATAVGIAAHLHPIKKQMF